MLAWYRLFIYDFDDHLWLQNSYEYHPIPNQCKRLCFVPDGFV